MRICIFAKPPIAGRAKTRLDPDPARAAELARAFLLDTCASARTHGWAAPVLATTDTLEPALERQLGLPVWQQGEGDLGARLERVLQRALRDYPGAIAIGADSPGMPGALLERAREALAEADAAIGRTDDGGFYALALRGCPDGLLGGLPWSASDTYAATLARLRARRLRVVELEPWFDVDRPGDLVRLRALLAAGLVEARRTQQALALGKISVVMPVLDEARRLPAALAALAATPGLHEVVVVDGGSRDGSAELARAAGVRVLHAPRGRGPQLNAGAAAATGDVLLFLHADTTLPPDAADHVTRTLADGRVVAGAFRTWTVADDPVWFAPLLHLADVRSRLTRHPYGDQALFVRADAFRAVGGFPAIPLMEDLELARRLWTRGRVATCDASVRVSGRRFVARPVVYTAIVNVFPLLYRAGVSPHVLARLYAQVR